MLLLELQHGETREDGHIYTGTHKGAPRFLSPKAFFRRLMTRVCQHARNRAAAEEAPFDLTTDYLISIYPGDSICPVLGEPMTFGQKEGRDTSPSIDRRVPALGYVRGNVAFISHRVNRLKAACTLEQLEKIVAHVKAVT